MLFKSLILMAVVVEFAQADMNVRGVMNKNHADGRPSRLIKLSGTPLRRSIRYHTESLSKPDQYETVYYEIAFCDQPDASNAILTINLPNNPNCDEIRGNALAEISTSKFVWNGTTVVQTNYEVSGDSAHAHCHSVSWPFNKADYPDSKLYIRIKNQFVQQDYSMQLQFSDTPIAFVGNHKGSLFQPAVDGQTDFKRMSQYFLSGQTESVQNYELKIFSFQFCADNFDFDPLSTWKVRVTATADTASPYSAMNMILCPQDRGQSKCRPTETNIPASQKDNSAVAVATAEIIRNADNGIENGIYVAIIGQGGSTSNVFTLSARVFASGSA